MNTTSSEKPGTCPLSVAVIMATFNRAHFISDAIESILNQTRPPEEFIIVNDGSTDDTATVVRRYGSKIKYVEKSNGGKASALNMILPLVESTHVCVFDDDDIALPDALESHLRFLSEHPECDFTYSPRYTFTGEFSDETLKQATLAKVPFTTDVVPFAADADYFSRLIDAPFLVNLMQGMLIPTHCFRAVGGFDEEMLGGEDWDILLRIARCFRAGFLAHPTFAQRLHDGVRGPNRERYTAADSHKVWQRYEQRAFEKLRASLTLREYLPRPRTSLVEGCEDRPLSATETRQALLRRAKVMAVHGLFPMAVDDFRAYIDQFGPRPAPLSDDERCQISMLAYVQNQERVPPLVFFQCLGTLSRGKPELFKAAMRGLYWSITREMRTYHSMLVSRLLGFGVVMAGAYAGMPMTRRRQVRGLR